MQRTSYKWNDTEFLQIKLAKAAFYIKSKKYSLCEMGQFKVLNAVCPYTT